MSISLVEREAYWRRTFSELHARPHDYVDYAGGRRADVYVWCVSARRRCRLRPGSASTPDAEKAASPGCCAPAGARQVVGLDYIDETIQALRDSDPGVSAGSRERVRRCATIAALGAFDLVFAIEILQCVPPGVPVSEPVVRGRAERTADWGDAQTPIIHSSAGWWTNVRAWTRPWGPQAHHSTHAGVARCRPTWGDGVCVERRPAQRSGPSAASDVHAALGPAPETCPVPGAKEWVVDRREQLPQQIPAPCDRPRAVSRRRPRRCGGTGADIHAAGSGRSRALVREPSRVPFPALSQHGRRENVGDAPTASGRTARALDPIGRKRMTRRSKRALSSTAIR